MVSNYRIASLSYKMNITVIILSLMLLAMANLSFSQSTFYIHSETGINISALPRSDKFAGGKEKILPVISPMAGLRLTKGIGRHIYISAGVQYYHIGEKYRFHKQDYDYLYKISYTHDQWEDIMYRVVSVPITVGYTFRKSKKTSVSAFAGYRFNHSIGGKYYHRNRFEHDATHTTDLTIMIDPFDESLELAAKRNNWQLLAGISANINQRVSVSFTFSQGFKIIYFQVFKPHPMSCISPYKAPYVRGDLALSLNYILFKKRNQPR